jgi:hypothetical protein
MRTRGWMRYGPSASSLWGLPMGYGAATPPAMWTKGATRPGSPASTPGPLATCSRPPRRSARGPARAGGINAWPTMLTTHVGAQLRGT